MADELPTPLEGRCILTQQVSYLRRNISFDEQNLTVKIGILPVGAIITEMKVYVKTGFTDTKLSIGTTYGGKDFGEKDIKDDKTTQDYAPTGNKFFVGDDAEMHLYATRDKASAKGQCVVYVKFIARK